MATIEDRLSRKGILASRFLTQETAANRGVNTFYPTSIINAAISIGAVTTGEAMDGLLRR